LAAFLEDATMTPITETLDSILMEIYDGAEWTEMDIDDLKAAIANGSSIEEAAQFLCRADSVVDVRRKCRELGLV
jgi:hypothetical protein